MISEQFLDVDFAPIPDPIALQRDIFPNNIIIGYNASHAIHHVLLHMSAKAPKDSTADERSHFVDKWMNKANLRKIILAISVADLYRIDGYSWQDRGFNTMNEVIFHAQVKDSLKKYGVAILSRKQTFEEGFRLQRRLATYEGFRASLVAMPYKGLAALLPLCQESLMSSLSPSSLSPSQSSISNVEVHGIMNMRQEYTQCKDCLCKFAVETDLYKYRGTTAFCCSTCNKELCLLCAYAKFSSTTDCQVLVGHLVATHIKYPPQDARIPIPIPIPSPPPAMTTTSVPPRAPSAAGGGLGVSGFNEGTAIDQAQIDEMQAKLAQLGIQLGNDQLKHLLSGHAVADEGNTELLITPDRLQLSSTPIIPRQTDKDNADDEGAKIPSPSAAVTAKAGGEDKQLKYKFEVNSKPRTKQSSIDHLPRSVFNQTQHNGTQTCVICFDHFSDGDSVITLPCSHFFHGDVFMAECDCLLITEHLKLSNECPVCQFSLEADVPPQHFHCSLCNANVPSNKLCPNCHYNEKVLSIAKSVIFDRVESLFLEITKFRLDMQKSLAASAGAGFDEAKANEIFSSLKVKELTCLIDQRKLIRKGMSEKGELVKVLLEDSRKTNLPPSIISDSHKIMMIHAKIDEIMQSNDIYHLQNCQWNLQRVRMILERNLSNHLGDDPWDLIFGIDNNSAALIRILIKRLVKVNQIKYPQDQGGNQLSVPTLFDWTCVLCSSINTMPKFVGPNPLLGAQECFCCSSPLQAKLVSLSEEYKPIYAKVCELASRGFLITIRVNSTCSASGSSVSGGGACSNGGRGSTNEDADTDAMRTALKADIAEYLDGPSSPFTDLHENRGFYVKSHLKAFFSRMLKYEADFSFEARGFLDISSVSLYATYIHKIREMVDQSPLLKGAISVEKPNAESIQHGDDNYFENFSVQINKLPRDSSVGKFLESQRELLMTISKLIAYGGTDVLWKQISSQLGIIARKLNIRLELAVQAMRKGVRDLTTLTEHFDVVSKFIIEAIFRKVKQLEMYMSFIQVDDLISGSRVKLSDHSEDLLGEPFHHSFPTNAPPLLKRMNSIGTDTRSAITSMKNSIPPEEYSEIIIHLFKISRNINEYPHMQAYRRLLKSKPAFVKYFAPHPEILSVLAFMGFVSSPHDTQHLFLPNQSIKKDQIARVLYILKEIAREDRIDLWHGKYHPESNNVMWKKNVAKS